MEINKNTIDPYDSFFFCTGVNCIFISIMTEFMEKYTYSLRKQL